MSGPVERVDIPGTAFVPGIEMDQTCMDFLAAAKAAAVANVAANVQREEGAIEQFTFSIALQQLLSMAAKSGYRPTDLFLAYGAALGVYLANQDEDVILWAAGLVRDAMAKTVARIAATGGMPSGPRAS